MIKFNSMNPEKMNVVSLFKKYQFIDISVTNNVTTISLNRPERHNALLVQIIEELHEVFDLISQNQEILFVVISGKGLSFCAGADLNWFSCADEITTESSKEQYKIFADLLLKIYKLPQITLAQVHGNVFGGGVGLMAVCDFVLAETKTRFMLSELKLGLLPAIIMPFISKRMNTGNLRKWVLTARLYDTTEAEKAGLIDLVFNENEAKQTLESFINKFAACSPNAMKQAKLLINKVVSGEINTENTEITSEILANALISDDGKEGIQAYLEKRNPKWYKP